MTFRRSSAGLPPASTPPGRPGDSRFPVPGSGGGGEAGQQAGLHGFPPDAGPARRSWSTGRRSFDMAWNVATELPRASRPGSSSRISRLRRPPRSAEGGPSWEDTRPRASRRSRGGIDRPRGHDPPGPGFDLVVGPSLRRPLRRCPCESDPARRRGSTARTHPVSSAPPHPFSLRCSSNLKTI